MLYIQRYRLSTNLFMSISVRDNRKEKYFLRFPVKASVWKPLNIIFGHIKYLSYKYPVFLRSQALNNPLIKTWFCQ